MIYEYGGIFDYLEDIHFPDVVFRPEKQPDTLSLPWYFWALRQNPTYFSFLAREGGWGARHIMPIIKILEIDSQVEVPTETLGSTTLEAAADRYVQRWDQNDPLDYRFFGRMQFSNKFFWNSINRKFPSWATGFKSGILTQRAKDNHPPIKQYIEDAITDYFTRWNNDSNAYNAHANSVPGNGDWDPLRTHSFVPPFPPQGITFAQLSAGLSNDTWWLGPFPITAWSRFNLLNTQSYCFTYGFGQLDPNEWDLSTWPPRRASIPQREGGSRKGVASAISRKWQGHDPFTDFLDSQFNLI